MAEIEKKIKETESMQPKFDQFWAGQISAFKGILKILSTLEMKEVNLEEIIGQTYHDRNVADTSDMDHIDYENIAEYFFELGLKVQKGE